VTLRSPNAFCHGIDLAMFLREEREDPIGFAEISPA
jgi:hypothetical protein